VEVLLIVVVSFVGYIIAYRTYGRFLARKVFRLNDAAPVPSRELEDGTDYVPTRKGIIFGHHYTSIAGTGPIVGPAIGIIWGWVPALIWVFVGSIVMGAVHDFGSLVVSLRNEGKSMSEITGRYVNKRARTIFFLIAFLELLIVIAIFCWVVAFVFDRYDQAVFPIWMEIPIAFVLGLAVYKWKKNVALATAAAVFAMYLTVVAGHWLPLKMPDAALGAFTLPAAGVWTALLLI
jgi:carbon starvation protein